MVSGNDIDKELYRQAEDLFTVLQVRLAEIVPDLDYMEMLEVAQANFGLDDSDVKEYREVLRALDIAD